MSRLEELQKLSLQPGGFDNDLDGQRNQGFRKVAWLYLLKVTDDLSIPDPPPTYEEEQKGGIAESSEAMVSAPSASSSKASSNGDLTPSSSRKSDLITDSDRIPVDKDGWQIGGKDLLQDPAEHEWKTVKSRKARRKKQAVRSEGGSPDPANDKAQEDPAPSTIVPQEAQENLIGGLQQKAETLADDSQGELEPSTVTPQGAEQEKQSQQETQVSTSTTTQIPSYSDKVAATKLPLDSLPPHPEEEQVQKDIVRSFVGPAFSQLTSSRTALRSSLSDLVLLTLRSHPTLHYFQGYHDILSLFLLQLGPSAPSATQRLSLHFIRDSMTSTLDPIMGHLKLLRNLLRVEDPLLAKKVERASALPFFALSWMITIFTHDWDEAWRVFDFVLSHGPKSVVYLCASVVLEKREEAEEEDEANLHMLLSKVPQVDVTLLVGKAKGLMDRHSFKDIEAEKVMGPKSVMFTWPPESGNWEQQDALADRIVTQLDAIVLDPHPEPQGEESVDEKGRTRKRYYLREASTVAVGTAVAVIGVAGVVMALYANDKPVSQAKNALGLVATVLGHFAPL